MDSTHHDPLVRRILENLSACLSDGNEDQMAAFTRKNIYDGVLKAHGHQVLVNVMSSNWINVPTGVRLRHDLLQKMISLGVDPIPVFLEVAYRGHLPAEKLAAASRPSMIVKEILSRSRMYTESGYFLYSLDSFLSILPRETIGKLRSHPEAFSRLFDITGDRELLKFVSNKRKGQVLTDDLGM